MEWKDLSDTAGCVLERCWGLHDDNPRTRRISIGEKFKVWDKEYTFTEKNYEEIVRYGKSSGSITVNRYGDMIVVTGKDETK